MDTFIDAMYSTLDVIGRVAWIALITLQGLLFGATAALMVFQFILLAGGSVSVIAASVIGSVTTLSSLALCFYLDLD